MVRFVDNTGSVQIVEHFLDGLVCFPGKKILLMSETDRILNSHINLIRCNHDIVKVRYCDCVRYGEFWLLEKPRTSKTSPNRFNYSVCLLQ